MEEDLGYGKRWSLLGPINMANQSPKPRIV